VKAVIPPDTPAGAQLRWLIAAAAHLPLSGAQIRAHFDAAYLAQSAAVLYQELQVLASFKPISIVSGEKGTELIATIADAAEAPQLPLRIPIGRRAAQILAARRAAPDDRPFIPGASAAVRS
jgi:ORF 12 gene product N-terminal